MNIYLKHLRTLCIGIALIEFYNLITALILRMYNGMGSPDVNTIPEFIMTFLFAASALTLAWMASGKVKNPIVFIMPLVMCVICAVYSTVMNYQKGIDVVIDFDMILVGLAIYSLLQTRRSERNWHRIISQKEQVIDLSITSRDDLFNSYVLGPHLELNMDLIGAVDRFLDTSGHFAPLAICIHSAVPISEPLQDTAREVFAFHYEDEERRVNQYLEGRYKRVIWLIIISIGALSIWADFATYEGSVTWQILGNLAAFSLWQVGSTFFERSAAYEELLRFQIARHATIEFHHASHSK